MFDIKEALKRLPDLPGVYLMKDARDEIIYVGKAVNLKNRVRSYFRQDKNHSPKVRAMVPHIVEFEYIVTDSEREALILENSLIKKYNPHYNILLKDDKTYPYIKVTVQEAFPKVFLTRLHKKDGARYFGPLTDVSAAKETLDLVHKLWPIRTCARNLPRDIGKERPCLNYHIGRCMAPCDGCMNQNDYQAMIGECLAFLEGKDDAILRKLEVEMHRASEEMAFEKAAELRDKIHSIKNIRQRQKMANTSIGDADAIAAAAAGSDAVVQIFFVRGGKVTGREHYFLSVTEGETKSEILTEFVKQFYGGTAFIPKEILLEEPVLPEEAEVLGEFLSASKGSKVTLAVPQKGEKAKLVSLSAQNAAIILTQFGTKLKREQERTVGAMDTLRVALGIEKEVRRVESYDISHTQGFASVGSMVVFEDGIPKRSDYRKFRIKSVVGANDFASMEEVLTRRINHSIIEDKKDSFGRLPDLIFMDGGKAQITAAETVLSAFGLSIPVCGMVKDDRHRSNTLLFQEREISLPKNSDAFALVTRIQDEVHRFAITYHRKLREESMLHSVLEDIPGIGQARKKALMKHFGDISAIQVAEVETLLEVTGMTIPAAEAVYAFFHQ